MCYQCKPYLCIEHPYCRVKTALGVITELKTIFVVVLFVFLL